jgi:hypothetical protein
MRFAMRRLSLIVMILLIAACNKETPAPVPNQTPTGTPSAAAVSQSVPASAADPDDAIGYPSVVAAKTAMSERKDVDSREDGGWTIVADQQAGAFWSFAPADHAAFPAVVKRTIHENEGKVSVAIAMLCEGPVAACADLKRKFDDLDERMRADLQKQADARKK